MTLQPITKNGQEPNLCAIPCRVGGIWVAEEGVASSPCTAIFYGRQTTTDVRPLPHGGRHRETHHSGGSALPVASPHSHLRHALLLPCHSRRSSLPGPPGHPPSRQSQTRAGDPSPDR